VGGTFKKMVRPTYCLFYSIYAIFNDSLQISSAVASESPLNIRYISNIKPFSGMHSQPHLPAAFLLLLPRRAHYMESAFPLFVIVVDVFLLFCHCPHKNALILSSEKIKNVDMNAAWGNKIW